MTRMPASSSTAVPEADNGGPAIDVVLDAGVAIKWYIPEIHTSAARRFLRPSVTLHVPDLFFAEFSNILWKKARLLKVPEITEDEGREILGLMLGVSLTVHPIAPLARAAYELAIRSRRTTVYDFCYLALAVAQDCRMVTADRAFYDEFKTGSYRSRLLWVADPF
jgi:predicted nucleic acid-binding protein